MREARSSSRFQPCNALAGRGDSNTGRLRQRDETAGKPISARSTFLPVCKCYAGNGQDKRERYLYACMGYTARSSLFEGRGAANRSCRSDGKMRQHATTRVGLPHGIEPRGSSVDNKMNHEVARIEPHRATHRRPGRGPRASGLRRLPFCHQLTKCVFRPS